MEAIGTLYLRGKKWRWKVKTPADLSHLSKYCNAAGKPKQNTADVNLNTEDRKEAQAKATILAAQWSATFDADRKGLVVSLQPPTPITPELGEAIAQSVYRLVLEQDDALRESERGMTLLDAVHQAGAAQSLKLLGIKTKQEQPQQRSTPGTGLSEGAAKTLSALTAHTEGTAAVALARRKLTAAKPLAEQAVERLGLRVDWETQEGLQTLRRCLEAYRKAWQDRSRRDAGEVVSTPAPHSLRLSTSPAGHKLRSVFERWSVGRSKPSVATVKNKRLALELFEQFAGDVDVESVRPEQGDDFATWLTAKPISEKTAKDRFDAVKSLLNEARRLRWIGTNPWADIAIKAPRNRPRKPWESEPLVKLFDSPLFKQYEMPQSSMAGGAASYWVTLLGLYSGARESELCQLRVKDVDEQGGRLFIAITHEPADEEEGTWETVTKTTASQRRIPVHSAVLALGFRDYWQAMRQAGEVSLFPDVKRKKGVRAGEYFSRWFGIYRKQQGVNERWQDFHAFRHTVKTRLVAVHVNQSIVDFIIGHADTRRGAAGVYQHPETIMPAVAEALDKLQYPELDLKRVYWPQK